jgi:hypothetical protein
MTGFFIITSGLSLTKADPIAGTTIFASNSEVVTALTTVIWIRDLFTSGEHLGFEFQIILRTGRPWSGRCRSTASSPLPALGRAWQEADMTSQPPKKRKRPSEAKDGIGHGKRGKPPYQPTDQDRRCVAAMAGLGMRHDDIRQVMGSGMKGRPGPLSKKCLEKYYRRELAAGLAILHFEVTKFRDAINAGAPWALMMALRNFPRFRFDRYDGKPFLPGDEPKTINVEFCFPTAKPNDGGGNERLGGGGSGPVVDAYANKPADLSLPALEPPRPRTTTETGAVYEQPREPPRSAFEQPGKTRPVEWAFL